MKLKVEDLIRLSPILEKAAAVVRNKDEDHNNVIKWKLACGKNFQQIQFPLQRARGLAAQLNTECENFFEKVKNALASEVAKRSSPCDIPQDYEVFFNSFEEKKEEELTDLDKAIRALPNFEELKKEAFSIDERCKKIDDFLAEEVEVQIATIPFNEIPDRISGGFLRELSFMITDIPSSEVR